MFSVKQLANDPQPGCAKRTSHCHFLLPCDGPRELQVGQVDTCDEKDKANGPEQEIERVPNVADHLLEERHDAEGEAAVGRIDFGILMPQARGDGIHLGLRLLVRKHLA